MSLRFEIRSKTSYTRRFMDTWFPDLPRQARKLNRAITALPTVCPADYDEQYLFMLVGTAIDYRLRAYFADDIHRSAIVKAGLELCELPSEVSLPVTDAGRGWVVNAWNRWRGPGGVADNFVKAFELFAAQRSLRAGRLPPDDEERLARFCFIIANLDCVGRSALSAPTFLYQFGSRDTDAMLAAVAQPVVDDLVRLSESFAERYKATIARATSVFLGQSLEGSDDVGGADFDLVVDGTLYDFKTTIVSKIETSFLRQVIGYWLLDYGDAFVMRVAAIDLTRQGHTERFDIANDLLRVTDPDELRRMFRKGLRSKLVPPIKPGLRLVVP